MESEREREREREIPTAALINWFVCQVSVCGARRVREQQLQLHYAIPALLAFFFAAAAAAAAAVRSRCAPMRLFTYAALAADWPICLAFL